MLANNGTRCVVHFILSVLKDTLHIIKGWTLVNLIKMYPLLAFTTQNTQISPRRRLCRNIFKRTQLAVCVCIVCSLDTRLFKQKMVSITAAVLQTR